MLEEVGKYEFFESTDFYHPALYAPELCRPVCPRPVLGVRGPGPESLYIHTILAGGWLPRFRVRGGQHWGLHRVHGQRQRPHHADE